jgi:hypothetical protein
LELLLRREFQPWEGGEGLVLSEYVRANVPLVHRLLQRGDPGSAIARVVAASRLPQNLGEAKQVLMNVSIIDCWLGVAHHDVGDGCNAKYHRTRATFQRKDFQRMQPMPVSENTYCSVLALRRLGREQEALHVFEKILAYSMHLESQNQKIDYFATSLPAMLLFEEDLTMDNAHTGAPDLLRFTER